MTTARSVLIIVIVEDKQRMEFEAAKRGLPFKVTRAVAYFPLVAVKVVVDKSIPIQASVALRLLL